MGDLAVSLTKCLRSLPHFVIQENRQDAARGLAAGGQHAHCRVWAERAEVVRRQARRGEHVAVVAADQRAGAHPRCSGAS